MRLKSFFADTIEEAIAQARQEMGPDAMLVNSKRSSAEARHLGACEVVVCSKETERGPSVAKPEGIPTTPCAGATFHQQFIARCFGAKTADGAAGGYPGTLGQWLGRLVVRPRTGQSFCQL